MLLFETHVAPVPSAHPSPFRRPSAGKSVPAAHSSDAANHAVSANEKSPEIVTLLVSPIAMMSDQLGDYRTVGSIR